MDKPPKLDTEAQEALEGINKFIDNIADEELKKNEENYKNELENNNEYYKVYSRKSSEDLGSSSSQKEKILQSNKFEKSNTLLGGNIGGACLVKIEGNGNGVLKPHTRFTEEEQIQYANQERAAYLISQFIGFDFVPLTVVKRLKNEKNSSVIASLQEFVEDASVAAEVDLSEVPQEELVKLAIFDVLILNDDRHPGNFLIKDNNIYAIDHGNAFDSNCIGIGMIRFSRYLKTEIHNTIIPDNIIKLLKNFKKWKQGQTILTHQLSELMDKEISKEYVRRIIDLTDCIGEDQIVNLTKFNNYQKSAHKRYIESLAKRA